jgi:hypothetical protein
MLTLIKKKKKKPKSDFMIFDKVVNNVNTDR